MEVRNYKITGNIEDLNALEQALGHIEYLGKVGASRNILIRVDGDGSGRIRVYKENKYLEGLYGDLEKKEYNIKQDLGQGATVGIYDIG